MMPTRIDPKESPHAIVESSTDLVILAGEDDKALCTFMEVALTQAGYRALSARDRREAVGSDRRRFDERSLLASPESSGPSAGSYNRD
jgi:hypothetical protein